jgi:hypothetical protein
VKVSGQAERCTETWPEDKFLPLASITLGIVDFDLQLPSNENAKKNRNSKPMESGQLKMGRGLKPLI